MNGRHLVALVMAFATASIGTVHAQAQSGSIQGRVKLDSGAPVHGATIVIVGARRTATTGEDGTFAIDNVPVGTYEAIAQREHFSAARQTVTVTAGAASSVEFTLTVATIHEELTVTANASGLATTFEAFNSVRSLDTVELARHRGATLADTLASLPGVAIRSFGAGSARPIIRGFDGDRVLIMQDGVRTGDLSSQSGDHGVSIDPAGLDRIEVVKGPATLLYGSNAVGGVVNAITPQEAFRTAPFSGLIGGLTMDGGSANAQAGANGHVQFARGAWHGWAGGGTRRTGDYETPIGAIENSATQLSSGRAGIGWAGSQLFFGAGVQFERSRFGIPFAGLFHHHHEGEEEEEEEHALEVDIKSARREFRADLGLRNLTGAFLDAVRVTFGHTEYDHDELEIEDGIESVGTVFNNRIASLRAELEQKRRGRLSGRLGVDWLGRDYTATGAEALAPPVTQSAFSAFLYEELTFGRWRAQFGGRIERTNYTVGERAEPEEPEDEEHEDHDHEVPVARDRSFTGASASFGIHADLGRSSALVVNLTAAARAPALEELFNFGPHVGNLAFEIGNPDLTLERSTGVDVSLRSRASRLSGELNLYMYDISNFVFLDFTGKEADGLREAEFLQDDSRFVGFEASGALELAGGAHVNFGIGGVRARLTGTDESLPRIPPLTGRVELELPWRGVAISPEVVVHRRQASVFRDETATAGSVLVNLSATWFLVRGHATHTIAVKAYNLADKEYRLHTSFIKELAPEMGRGVRVTYSMRFF